MNNSYPWDVIIIENIISMGCVIHNFLMKICLRWTSPSFLNQNNLKIKFWYFQYKIKKYFNVIPIYNNLIRSIIKMTERAINENNSNTNLPFSKATFRVIQMNDFAWNHYLVSSRTSRVFFKSVSVVILYPRLIGILCQVVLACRTQRITLVLIFLPHTM